ncbi:MAG: LemA family protein [Eubacterium sp.]|nr:LemA family protein [Eubacterium sp.]
MGYFIIALVVMLGIAFIYITTRINKLESVTRDKNAEVDAGIWDRGFRLGKLVEALDKAGIKHEIEAPDTSAFTLGTPASMQSVTSEQLDKAGSKLKEVVEKHPELKQDVEFVENLEKFDVARNDMFKASLAYNKSVSAYNGFISAFPGNVIANLRKKSDKQIFTYVFTDIKKDNPIE